MSLEHWYIESKYCVTNPGNHLVHWWFFSTGTAVRSFDISLLFGSFSNVCFLRLASFVLFVVWFWRILIKYGIASQRALGAETEFSTLWQLWWTVEISLTLRLFLAIFGLLLNELCTADRYGHFNRLDISGGDG